MDRGAWRATVPTFAKNPTRLKRLSTAQCVGRTDLCFGNKITVNHILLQLVKQLLL